MNTKSKMKIAILLICLIPLTGLSKEITLTFDDAPLGNGQIFTGVERTKKIVETLKKHEIQAAFFVNTARLSNSNSKERIQKYSAAGHLIANHTHNHLRLIATNTMDFIAEIEKADSLLKDFPTFVKWFRYPYLNEGPTIESRDEVRAYLKTSGYMNAYVTVDNYDYFINEVVKRALIQNQKVHFDRACSMLSDLTLDGLRYYDQIAQEHIGKVRHVLLMHENDIEALCLEKLIGDLKSNGWKIIKPQLAFEDPPLKGEPDTLYLDQGRIAAIAHVKTGIKYRASWENVQSLQEEFNKRKIVETK